MIVDLIQTFITWPKRRRWSSLINSIHHRHTNIFSHLIIGTTETSTCWSHTPITPWRIPNVSTSPWLQLCISIKWCDSISVRESLFPPKITRRIDSPMYILRSSKSIKNGRYDLWANRNGVLMYTSFIFIIRKRRAAKRVVLWVQ